MKMMISGSGKEEIRWWRRRHRHRHREQCDQMPGLFFIFGHLKLEKYGQKQKIPKNAKEGSKFCQILNNPSKNCQSLSKCHQSGEISQNLVALIVSEKQTFVQKD